MNMHHLLPADTQQAAWGARAETWRLQRSREIGSGFFFLPWLIKAKLVAKGGPRRESAVWGSWPGC